MVFGKLFLYIVNLYACFGCILNTLRVSAGKWLNGINTIEKTLKLATGSKQEPIVGFLIALSIRFGELDGHFHELTPV